MNHMIFDAHSDMWEEVLFRRLDGETNVFERLHLERFRKGGIEGSVFNIFVDPPHDANPRPRTEQIMATAAAEIAESDAFQIVHNYDELLEAKRQGKIYALIGVEGMAAMGTELEWFDRYYDFGVRLGMLTWNEANALGAGASSGETYGLTELGKAVVRKMQEKHMVIDVSHLNDAGFWDIAGMVEGPFIASHSNCRALCPAPRNLTDEQMRAIRDCGGVVGLNAYKFFVDEDPEKQTVERLAQHAAHMIDVMGIDHVGCGFDFFEFIHKPGKGATNSNVRGLESCGEVPNLFTCFDKMGMSREEQEKIASKNFHRVLRQMLK